MTLAVKTSLFVFFSLPLLAQTPAISKVANAEGETAAIAPNTWVEIKGQNLSAPNDSRIWQGTDFVKNQMPTALDGVSVTVNGKSAFIYYISPTQINILTPPDAMPASVPVVVTRSGVASSPFNAPAQSRSPSFFIFNGGPYVAATHADGSLIGPTSLYPGSTTPARPGETVVVYANGFGSTTRPVISGSPIQSGALSPQPTVTVGDIPATILFAGLVAPGQFQFNIVIPPDAGPGDNSIVATINGTPTAPATSITIQSAALLQKLTYYVAPNGNDSWSGTLPSPNAASTDGPFQTFDHARAAVQKVNQSLPRSVTVQFRGGSYSLTAPQVFTTLDSGTSSAQIIYQNYPNESPVFSGGIRLQNWTNTFANVWTTHLPASVQYFENLFYNGTRRLRPRLGGALGTYLRNAGPVYLNAPGPPANPPDANCSVYVTGSGWECFDRFKYNPSDPIVSNWKNLAPASGNHCSQTAGNQAIAGDIEVLDFEQYSVSKLRVSCIDSANNIVYLTGPTATEAAHPTAHGFIQGHRYLIENVQDALTAAGQWFLDRSATPWTLTYLANPGENPNTDTVLVPQLSQLLVATNLQYVTFQGLTFEHDNYTIPSTGYDGVSEIIAAVSFQNTYHVVFDSNTVTQTSGSGLEFISCLDATSLPWCESSNVLGSAVNNTVQNSAFYDVAAVGIRIGNPGTTSDTNGTVPQFNTIQNNVIEGYGRVFPGSSAISQGQGHDNIYTHNDIYDGYKTAIKVCYCAASDNNPPFTNNNVVSFNHAYNLFQGITNDNGSIYIAAGVQSPPSTGFGNKVLNNKVHDVSDASILDTDGYGGDGIYAGDYSGNLDIENNLIYRVSGSAIGFSGPRAGNRQSSTIKNNILAYARTSMFNAYNPYAYGTAPPSPMFFTASNNLIFMDRGSALTPPFYVQGGCVYAGGTYTSFEQFSSNMYWRTDAAFANDPQAFRVQQTATPANSCGPQSSWTFYNFAGWQKLGEDVQSVIQNPGFNNATYPADDYTLSSGSPGVGFIVFDPNQAGRTNPAIHPPAIPPTFPTKLFNPATDY